MKLFNMIKSWFKPKPTYKIVGGWRDHLIWCPSQCNLNMIFDDRHFVLYLRWRHGNPWTCNLIEVEPDGEFDDVGDNAIWHELNISYWKDDDNPDDIKEDAIIMAIKWYYENK